MINRIILFLLFAIPLKAQWNYAVYSTTPIFLPTDAALLLSIALPDTTGHSSQFLKVLAGGGYGWATASGGGGSGTVTSITLAGNNGISISGTNPITSSGTVNVNIANGSIGDSSLHSTFFKVSNNLSEGTASTMRTNLGLGTLATQSGTFSGTSSGTNTGDVTLSGENYLSLSGQAITVNAVALGGTNVSGILTPAKGGTGFSTYTTGDLIYSSATNTLSKLAIGTTNQVLQVVGGAPSWQPLTSSATTTTAIIDLNSPTAYGVKDTLLSGTGVLIHVTSKPTIPQFYYVIKAADIPVSTIPTGYMAVVTFGGKNRNVTSAPSLNFMPCRGTNPATEFPAAIGPVALSTSQTFWESISYYNSKSISVGDTLAVKLWATVADTVDYRYATIYFMPRLITPPAGQIYFYGVSSSSSNMDFQSTLAGANSGVAYATTLTPNQPQMQILDSIASGIIAAFGTGTSNIPVSIGTGQYFEIGSGGGLSDVSTTILTTSSATLGSFGTGSATGGRPRYFRKWTIH